MDWYFRALGPLTVEGDGAPIDLGGQQGRAVLAVLLASANRVVPVARLVDVLWGDTPPPTHRIRLQGLVSDLRRRLAPGRRAEAPIVTRAPGYLLRVPAGRCDATEFRDRVADARQARARGDNPAAVRLFRAALDLWRGNPYADVPYEPVERVAAELAEARVDAIEECIAAQLDCGDVDGLLDELPGLVAEHPLRERFAAQLMSLYGRAGRRAEALVVYSGLRRHLVRELGIEPSAELRDLQRQILVARDDGTPAHRHLPPDIAEFTGRDAELAALESIGARAGGSAPMVVVVDGMAGVGKTRLVLRAAHRLAAHGFPDGQLHADLCGFDPDQPPAHPSAVLASFLRLLGVPDPRIPHDLDGRGAVFRDRLAGKRFLVVLDNAADAAQIRPLLPAGASCLTLVTTRRSLDLDGAATVTLHPFAEAESFDLLGTVVGARRVAAERSAAAELVAHCGGLPLAVALAARRLRARPAWSIRHAVDRLAEHELGVEGVFHDSYRSLEPERQRVFRLLGVHPGADATALSVAALAGIPPTAADAALESLVDEHLLYQDTPGRYRLHDLVRTFAVRQCREPTEREAALSRLLDWYVSVAGIAASHLRKYPLWVDVGIPPSPSPGPDLPDAAAATAWFDAEQGNLLAAVRHTRDGWPAHAIQFAHLLRPYLVRLNRVTDWIATQEAGLAAALRIGHGAGRAYGLAELGEAYNEVGRTDRSLTCLRRALELHRRLGEGRGMAFVQQRFGIVQWKLGRYVEAVAHYRAALALLQGLAEPAMAAGIHSGLGIVLHLAGRDHEALDHMTAALELERTSGGPGEASLRTNLGRLCARLGRYPESIEHAERALALHRRARSQPGEAHCLANLSVGYAAVGRFAEAMDAGHRALDIGRRLADRSIEASAWNHLGDAHRMAGDPGASLEHHRAALAVTDGIPLAEERELAERGIHAALAALANA